MATRTIFECDSCHDELELAYGFPDGWRWIRIWNTPSNEEQWLLCKNCIERVKAAVVYRGE